MNKNKFIVKCCPNFHKIINFNYEKCDYLTSKIISIYRSYIFNIDVYKREELVKIQELDKVVYKYLNDYNFRIELEKVFPVIEFVTSDNIVNSMVDNILNIYDKYLEGTTRKIHIARWI